MRESCLGCVYKHLADAYIAAIEYDMGYPDESLPLVVGNLSHAAQEVIQVLPELAVVLRAHRLAWFEDVAHDVPYIKLCAFVITCIRAEALGYGIPELPEELVFETDQKFHKPLPELKTIDTVPIKLSSEMRDVLEEVVRPLPPELQEMVDEHTRFHPPQSPPPDTTISRPSPYLHSTLRDAMRTAGKIT